MSINSSNALAIEAHSPAAVPAQRYTKRPGKHFPDMDEDGAGAWMDEQEEAELAMLTISMANKNRRAGRRNAY